MFIYLIANHETGKYYVGQHKGKDLKKYLQTKLSDAKHFRGGSSYLYASMRAHLNPLSWSIHALRSDITDRAELDQTEREFITFLRSTDPEYGYNICRGGEGFSGPHSKETRDKMSESHKRQWADPKARNEHSETMKRVLASPAAKSNKSRAMKKLYTTSKVVVESLRKGWYGPKDYSSEALRKRWADSETRKETIKAIKNWWTLERRIAFSQRPRDERGRLLSVL